MTEFANMGYLARGFIIGYILISIVLAVINVTFAGLTFHKKGKTGKYFAYINIFAAGVNISYLMSALSKSYWGMSLMSSIYFICVDWMLISLIGFCKYYIRFEDRKIFRILHYVIIVYGIFEIFVYALNPFVEIAIRYKVRNTPIAPFVYDKLPLFYLHLIFTYAMVIFVIVMIILKTLRTTKLFREQYYFIIAGIIVVVAINAVFLFVRGDYIYNLLDYSILGYSICCYFMYYGCFRFTTNSMLKDLSMLIFDNISQAIVLFDYEGLFVMENERGRYLLAPLVCRPEMTMKEFVEECHIPIIMEVEEDIYSIQCDLRKDENALPLRCDFRRMRDDKNQVAGYLFVFTDAALDTDILTGYHNWESFRRFAASQPAQFTKLVATSVFDINNLSLYNASYGREAGDQKIRELAETIRKYMPVESYFVRGEDANLIVISYQAEESEIRARMKLVEEHFSGNIQCAISMSDGNDPSKTVLKSIQEALCAMKNKKMMDLRSTQSNSVKSLIRALQETDSDTEAHVRRTQLMGEKLGKRIGLSDMQQSDLSLLCLLHDIGKIGIPVEILNKPGKLTAEEWTVIQSHVEKGYQIVKSSKELSHIAEMILHHHERWDGKGYPAGLSRESIPILSRVISVVDAFDAMVNNRAYRKAYPINKAISELKHHAGTQFDPYIVSEFIEMIKEEQQGHLFDDYYEADIDEKDIYSMKFQVNLEVHKEQNVFAHSISFSTYILDGNDKIISMDDSFTELTGYTKEDVFNNNMGQMDLIPKEDQTEYLLLLEESLTFNSEVYIEHRIQKKDGSTFYVLCYGNKTFDLEVNEYRSEMVIVDVSKSYTVKSLFNQELNKSQERLKHWEDTYRVDPLTGLLARTAFQNDVEMQLISDDKRVMFFMIDMDKFKNYNDTYGHDAGDELLIFFANILKKSLRDDDLACRMGGDEFAISIFFDKEIDEDILKTRAKQIFEHLTFSLSTVTKNVTISMGVVFSDDSINKFKLLYKASDLALYDAKASGKNQLKFYGESFNKE